MFARAHRPLQGWKGTGSLLNATMSTRRHRILRCRTFSVYSTTRCLYAQEESCRDLIRPPARKRHAGIYALNHALLCYEDVVLRYVASDLVQQL